MMKRLAAVAALGLVLVALLLTFLPASGDNGSPCGTWVSPAMSEDELRETNEKARGVIDEGLIDTFELEAQMVAANADFRQCQDTLSSRRLWSLLALGAGVLVPVGILYVGGGRREYDA
ncbi:hypothetical protein K8W59_11090 [Nocardioides rotundus]|uniref:hypothetical protein n=1 Tax=Nocardioides rotundus TaxID=1774216 RepID=UPI001CBBB52F|nr:hypothetical protein [Nocardioides rotundus]UAL28425.1 hypothetical protein K8W59_11090 [Nocardioides rotundus]